LSTPIHNAKCVPDYYRALGWDKPFIWQTAGWQGWPAALRDIERIFAEDAARKKAEDEKRKAQRRCRNSTAEQVGFSLREENPSSESDLSPEQLAALLNDTYSKNPHLTRDLVNSLRAALEGRSHVQNLPRLSPDPPANARETGEIRGD
jgi:hypothetical protein